MDILQFFPLVLLIVNIPTSLHFFGRSWCPYQSDSVVQCKVRNGSEFYMSSTPLCSKDPVNGSLTCMQRVLRRPKYVTTYKKVTQTKYKCCPSFTGTNCQTECFNCSSFVGLEKRVDELEKRDDGHDKKRIPAKDTGDQKAIVIEYNTSANLDRSIRLLLTNVRNLDFRLEAVEREMLRLSHLLQKRREENPGPEYQILQSDPSDTLKKNDHLMTTFKILEKNLARGDIASTLNDEYGEDASVSGEDYEDELKPMTST